MSGFDKLIAALQIFKTYSDTKWPTNCEHDTLQVMVDPSDVNEKDQKALLDLGFIGRICKSLIFSRGSWNKCIISLTTVDRANCRTYK
jgi:hypothetical protein